MFRAVGKLKWTEMFPISLRKCSTFLHLLGWLASQFSEDGGHCYDLSYS